MAGEEKPAHLYRRRRREIVAMVSGVKASGHLGNRQKIGEENIVVKSEEVINGGGIGVAAWYQA